MKTESRKNPTTVKMASDREVVVMRTFDAPARLVFEAWSTPELFRQWWVPRSLGATLRTCELDVRTGGTYRLEFGDDPADTMAFYGRYLEVVPNSRIVWTNDEGGAESASVTTVVLEERDGKTHLVLRASPARRGCSARRAVVVMPSDAPAIKRERVAADGAEIVVVGTASDERRRSRSASRRSAASRSSRRSTTTGSSPARARSASRSSRRCRTSPRSSSRSAAAGSRAASRRPSGRSPRAPADRRRAGARRRRRRIARARARSSAGRPSVVSRTIADGTRTQALGRRTFAHLSRAARRDRHGVSEEEIAAGGPARRRGEPARRRAVRRAERRGAGVPARRGGPRGPRRPDRGGRLRRQRRPGALPGLPRGADPAGWSRA